MFSFIEAKYACVCAKVRAMYGKRVKAADYQALIGMKSVAAIADYLRANTSYAEVFEQAAHSDIHRGQLESTIRLELFREYIKIFRVMSISDQSVGRYLLLKNEADALYLCLRAFNAGEPFTLSGYSYEFLEQFSRIDLEKLRAAQTFADILRVLEPTPYYRIIRDLPPGKGGLVNLTALERALQTYYYQSVFDVIDRHLKGNERKNLRNFFLAQIELENIGAILRLKKYYHAKLATIEFFLLPFYSRLTRDDLKRLIAMPTPEAILDALKSGKYRRIFGAYDYPYIEGYTRHAVHTMCQSILRRADPSVTVPVAYLTLKEIEVNNLVNIIECVRYGVPPDQIEAQIGQTVTQAG